MLAPGCFRLASIRFKTHTIQRPQLAKMSTTALSDIHKDHSDSWHGKVEDKGRFPPESGRYHLYIGLFCPFAHRANLARHLKGLTNIIDISVVKPYPKGDDKGWPGWRFDSSYPGATPDKLFGSQYLHEVYFKADNEYKGKYSVPALWDTKEETLVNTESAEMLRWFQTSFKEMVSDDYSKVDLYPQELRQKIDTIADWMASDLNTGVYKAGFAPDQETYDKNVVPVFSALNKLEKIIAENGGPYILGEKLTELDIRLYVTAIRFDTVYHQHFKCNLGSIRHDYPVINNWMRHLYWKVKGFKESTDFKHIKENVSLVQYCLSS